MVGGDKGRKPRRVALGVALALAALIAGAAPVLATRGSVQRFEPATVDSKVLDQLAANGKASFVIYLKDQANLSTAYGMKNQDARGWYVYKTLKAEAARTQGPIKAMLASRGISYRSFWVANVIMASGDRSLVDSLAARSDVKTIEASTKSNWLAGVDSVTPKAPRSPDTVEPGINQVHAPALWALGYTGQGIVVGNEDTGMRWTHNALKPHYRGWNGTTADHNYNWHDSIHSGGGICSPDHMEPCDDHGHGTHTTGTAVGDDGAGNQIGVAPGAKWIGCRNMDQGNGTPATYTECFQWFIAPTDLNNQNPDPTLRPHVINNSWICPASEGCSYDTLRTIVENTEAAGIFVEASAGNGGSACSTVGDPPAIYQAAFSTGALNTGQSSVASFSSRGPVTVDGSGRIKPDIAAPGQPQPLVGQLERYRLRVLQRHLDGRPARRRRRCPALVGSSRAWSGTSLRQRRCWKARRIRTSRPATARCAAGSTTCPTTTSGTAWSTHSPQPTRAISSGPSARIHNS